ASCHCCPTPSGKATVETKGAERPPQLADHRGEWSRGSSHQCPGYIALAPLSHAHPSNSSVPLILACVSLLDASREGLLLLGLTYPRYPRQAGRHLSHIWDRV